MLGNPEMNRQVGETKRTWENVVKMGSREIGEWTGSTGLRGSVESSTAVIPKFVQGLYLYSVFFFNF
jgi:hypothetical protein